MSSCRSRSAACRRACIGALFAAAATLALAGCGFHLRGQIDLPFQTLYLNVPSSEPFAAAMKRAIDGAGGVKLADSATAAQLTLDVPTVVDDKQVLSLSGGGRAREYLLTKRVAYRLHDAEGRDWIPAGEITLRRSYSFNESEVLAREFQEQKYLTEMQGDAAQQLLRRMQAAKKPAE